MNESELMQKLMMSKAIMDKSNNIKNSNRPMTEGVTNFDIPQASYNIPPDLLEQQNIVSPPKQLKQPSVEAIKNSKLPDAIKKLMIEHPIVQPNTATNPVLSDELVERATRLMGKTNESKIPEKSKSMVQEINPKVSEGIDYGKIQKMVENTVNKILKENGMLLESFEKSNESFTFKVGKHVFEGKVTKIKKVS